MPALLPNRHPHPPPPTHTPTYSPHLPPQIAPLLGAGEEAEGDDDSEGWEEAGSSEEEDERDNMAGMHGLFGACLSGGEDSRGGGGGRARREEAAAALCGLAMDAFTTHLPRRLAAMLTQHLTPWSLLCRAPPVVP